MIKRINEKKLKSLLMLVFILLIGNYSYVFSEDDPFFQEDTYIVVGDKVNVREKPKITSKIILQLKITGLVKLIRRSGIKYKSGNIEGEWVYIDTGKSKDIMRNETYKGWVIDYYLAKGNQFEEVKEFYDCILEGYVGDYYIYYIFKKNGTYEHRYFNPIKNTNERYIGKLYKFRNVLVAKDFGVQRFYLINNNIFCTENDICTKINGHGYGN